MVLKLIRGKVVLIFGLWGINNWKGAVCVVDKVAKIKLLTAQTFSIRSRSGLAHYFAFPAVPFLVNKKCENKNVQWKIGRSHDGPPPWKCHHHTSVYNLKQRIFLCCSFFLFFLFLFPIFSAPFSSFSFSFFSFFFCLLFLFFLSSFHFFLSTTCNQDYLKSLFLTFLVFDPFFSCPGQLNRWPCHSVSEWVSESGFDFSDYREHCRAVVDTSRH